MPLNLPLDGDVRHGSRANVPEPPCPAQPDGEGDRSAIRLSGGGASAGRAKPKDAVGDRSGVREHVARGDTNNP